MSAGGQPRSTPRETESASWRGMWVCSVHNRWTKIVKPEGDTVRPCPECPRYGARAPEIRSMR